MCRQTEDLRGYYHPCQINCLMYSIFILPWQLIFLEMLTKRVLEESFSNVSNSFISSIEYLFFFWFTSILSLKYSIWKKTLTAWRCKNRLSFNQMTIASQSLLLEVLHHSWNTHKKKPCHLGFQLPFYSTVSCLISFCPFLPVKRHMWPGSATITWVTEEDTTILFIQHSRARVKPTESSASAFLIPQIQHSSIYCVLTSTGACIHFHILVLFEFSSPLRIIWGAIIDSCAPAFYLPNSPKRDIEWWGKDCMP